MDKRHLGINVHLLLFIGYLAGSDEVSPKSIILRPIVDFSSSIHAHTIDVVTNIAVLHLPIPSQLPSLLIVFSSNFFFGFFFRSISRFCLPLPHFLHLMSTSVYTLCFNFDVFSRVMYFRCCERFFTSLHIDNDIRYLYRRGKSFMAFEAIIVYKTKRKWIWKKQVYRLKPETGLSHAHNTYTTFPLTRKKMYWNEWTAHAILCSQQLQPKESDRRGTKPMRKCTIFIYFFLLMNCCNWIKLETFEFNFNGIECLFVDFYFWCDETPISFADDEFKLCAPV